MATYPTLDAGTYIYDTEAQAYVASNADGGKTVSGTVSINQQNYLYTTELYVIPGAPYQVVPNHGGMQQITKSDGSTTNSAVFNGDAGVSFYPDGTPLTKITSGTPAAGEYLAASPDISVGGIGGYGQYTFAAADAGKEVVIRYLYLNPDFDTFAAQFSRSLDIRPGLQGQTPSSYIESAHPDQAVGYSGTATVEGDGTYLGTSGALPNYTYETMGMGVVGGGVLDADPVACAKMILTDPIIGVGLPSDRIDATSWTTAAWSAAAWVKANQFYISQAVQNPQAAAGIIGRWLDAFNVAAVWSDGVLKLVPYGDQSVGGYTPNLTIAAELDDDCYLAGSGGQPVKMSRTPWADAYNRVQVNYKNRSNSYNDDLVYEQDEASIERFGMRIRGADSLDFITTWQLASAVANMALKRLVTVRNSFEFELPITYEYLEPGDLVSITDSRMGLSGKVVRITKVDNAPPAAEGDAGGLSLTCEDWPGNGYAMPVSNPKASTPANHPTSGTSPAAGTAAIILQASNASASQQGSRLYIWCRGADSSVWAGCAVYYSLDGTNYAQLGLATQPAPAFVLTDALASVTSAPSGSLGLTHDASSQLKVAPATTGNQVAMVAGLPAWDPETEYSAADSIAYDGAPWVALQANNAQVPTLASPYWQKITSAAAAAQAPQPITEAAASALFNLSAVIAQTGGAPTAVEFLAFADVAAGALPNTYTLSDLYRGALGTEPAAFPAGSQLVEFDAASVTWDIPAGLAGQTVYLKFLSWNTGGQSRQTLDNAPVVEFVIAASGGAGVWDSLGGPVADVVGTGTGGRGELIVDPAGGVSGELPYPNHSSAVTGVVNSGGQLVHGTELDLSGSLTLGDWHDRVKATIGGSGSSGLDNVGDGTDYRRSAAYSSAANIAPNPGFEASANLPPAGWAPGGVGMTAATLSWDTSTQYAGARSLVLTSSGADQGISGPKFSCNPGQQFKLQAALKTVSGGGTNAQVAFISAAGAEIGFVAIDSINDGTWHVITATGTAPAGTVAAQITIPSNSATVVEVDAVYCVRVASLDDEVADGTTYGRPLGARLNAGRPTIDFSEAIHSNQTVDYLADGSTYFRTTANQRDGGGRGYAAIDSGNIVVATGLDFARAYTGKHLDNIPDGTTYGRPLGARLNAGRPTIDFSEAIHSNQTVDYLADGSTYFRTTANQRDGGGRGYAAIDSGNIVVAAGLDFSRSYTGKHLDNIPDGTTYGRPLGARLNAGRPTIDFSEAIHSNQTVDYLADGTDYRRSAAYSSAANIAPNPGFEASANLPPAGWAPGGVGMTAATLSWDTSTQYAGARSLVLTSSGADQGISGPKFSCNPGQQFKLQAALKTVSGGGTNAQVAFISAAGAEIGFVAIDSINDGTWHVITATGTAPAGTVAAQITIPSNSATVVEVDAVYCVRVASLDDEVADGTTYGRPLGARLNAGRPTIDFSEAIHSNQTVDYLADGSTYFRTTANQRDGGGRGYAAIDSGNIVVATGLDFSRSYTGKHLDNIPDGTTYGRPLGARLNAGRPTIDFSEAIHSNQTVDYLADGSTYFRTTANQRDGGGRGYAAIDSGNIVVAAGLDFSRSYTGKHLDNIPDGTTYGRPLGARLNAGRPTIDFSEAIHSNQTVDYLADGTDYRRSAAYSSAANIAPNPGFEASANLPPAGWAPGGVGMTAATLSWDTSTQYAGARSLVLTSSGADQGISGPKFSCNPGQQFKLQAALKTVSGGGANVQVAFISAAGAEIGWVAINSINDGTWHVITATGTAPAGTVAAQITIPSNSATVVEVDAVYCVRVASLDDEVYGQLSTSGNLPNNSIANSTNTATVDSVDAGSSATVRVYGAGGVGTAWARYFGAATLTLPAVTITGLAYATKYYVAYDPATSTYVCTTSYISILPDGYVWAGAVTTVSAGGSGGDSGGGGDDGGGTGNDGGGYLK